MIILMILGILCIVMGIGLAVLAFLPEMPFPIRKVTPFKMDAAAEVTEEPAAQKEETKEETAGISAN